MMKKQIEKQGIRYHLDSLDDYSPLAYKVVSSGAVKGISAGTLIHYDRKTQILFPRGEYNLLDNLMSQLDFKQFTAVLRNILASLVEVEHHGLIETSQLDLTTETIFVNEKTLATQLIFLPVTTLSYDVDKAIDEIIAKAAVLEDTDYTRERVLQIFRHKHLTSKWEGLNNLLGDHQEEDAHDDNDGPEVREVTIDVCYLNADNGIDQSFKITQDKFMIGRQAHLVDGVVPPRYNRVGRKHCEIVKIDDQFYIKDLNSLNGTYLNGVRLSGQRNYPLKDGMAVSLANMVTYTVKMSQEVQHEEVKHHHR